MGWEWKGEWRNPFCTNAALTPGVSTGHLTTSLGRAFALAQERYEKGSDLWGWDLKGELKTEKVTLIWEAPQ